ncbi:16S rRNA m(2)G 1207 methyltransferase [Mesocricetibacter intestinalis]|uniref:Ribosomal RNA small subunit methyltransferase C n=1 Tax=Mesocricetibacter intestinalis TaxID=1521930 RepID=A0A4R6VGE6_9PAST|nr:16S rRNA (guanine(1207)-N(2))-methyltransferase RsmC [Mesocricetibacter intestinalis]TDQ59891.1 16S rRNA m(2)G 1207 methyltransferase [Mesocricetibacter intestinalis]
MISAQSQVLERHLSLLQNKTLLFAGVLQDEFPQKLREAGSSVLIWSVYFDYARKQSAVSFGTEFDGGADLLIYYWSKNKQEVQFQLMQMLANSRPGQQMLIIGENRCGVRSVEKLLAPFGDIAKIDGARRCGLYHFELKSVPQFKTTAFWQSYRHPQLADLCIYSLPGVFSAVQLDAGTDLLLSTLDGKIGKKVLDMGCGAGVIGSYIQRRYPETELTMADIHAMALTSAERTLAENGLKGKVVASDVFSHIEEKFDLIISNPPFHDGIDTAYYAVEALIRHARAHLRPGGELRIVANAFLPYPDLLDACFGSHRLLAKTGKFKVYSARA